VLIIEDNRDVATYIESLLKKDYTIEIARNGQIGIDKALEIIPDIIISDVMMPEKNGYEVCQFLKNDERSSHIPIILLTAKATAEDRIEGLKEGADAYLIKPFNKEELFVRLEKLVEVRKALQEHFASNNRNIKSKSSDLSTSLSLDERFLQKLSKVVEEKLNDNDLAVVHLCRAVNLSNMQVNRKLKALTGKTPSRFIRSIRLQKAIELLQTTELNISEIAYEVGFSEPNYFSRVFSEEFGYPPNVIRK
jgi:DNA-binding response OmpR family regulator